MERETFLICMIVMLGTALGMGFLFSYRGKLPMGAKQESSSPLAVGEVCVPTQLERKRLEFMKLMMVVLLAMWVLGCLCGLWMVVVLRSIEALELAQNFISYPLTAGVISYSCKSGFENCSKNKTVTNEEGQVDIWEENEAYGPEQ